MKKATLTISFDSEKLDALTYHMSKKDADLQTELEDTVQKLYEKHVPATVRDYIDETANDNNSAKKPEKQQRG